MFVITAALVNDKMFIVFHNVYNSHSSSRLFKKQCTERNNYRNNAVRKMPIIV